MKFVPLSISKTFCHLANQPASQLLKTGPYNKPIITSICSYSGFYCRQSVAISIIRVSYWSKLKLHQCKIDDSWHLIVINAILQDGRSLAS